MRKDIYREVKRQMEQDIKINCSDLGRKFGCDRRTVNRYKNSSHSKRKKVGKKLKLDPFKDLIREKVEKYSASAKAIFEFIKKKGYIGEYGLVKEFIRKEKIEGQKKATIRFETMPGVQAQVDWKEKLTLINKKGEHVTINIFLYIMGCSRWKYIELEIDKKQDTLFKNLQKAFKLSGGVPSEILFDNMKTVVDQTRKSLNGLKINAQMKQFAKDYRFNVKTCMPYRPQTKGKVEVVAKVMNRLKPFNEEFETLEDLKKIIKELNYDLNSQKCQATGEAPEKLLQKEIKFLKELPQEEVVNYYKEAKVIRKVTKESMVQYETRKYSVPTRYIGKEVELVMGKKNKKIEIYYQAEKIRTHEIEKKHQNYNFEDLKDILKSDVYKRQDDEFIENQAKRHLETLEQLCQGV